PPVAAAPHRLEVGGAAADEVRLAGRRVVERRVRQGDVGDPRALQPGAVGRGAEPGSVKHAVVLDVELPLPAPGQREPPGHEHVLPVVAGAGYLDPAI